MGSSCDELQCRGVAFNENRQKRDAKDDDGDDYDVILDDVIENDEEFVIEIFLSKFVYNGLY